MFEVLMLVTNEDAPFFQHQVKGLERLGVSCTVVPVPTSGEPRRSLTDYAKFYGSVLKRVPDSIDLVHANFGLTAPAALAQPHRPVVLSLWGTDLMGEFGDVSRWCANRCSEVIVMSEEMGNQLDRDCHVIPHGVDLDRFQPMDQAEARAEVGWPEDRPTVLFPYDPSRDVKNHELAAAVTDVAGQRLGQDVALEVVRGEPHERIPTFMNAADALLLTSDREGSPNVVKEALACDVPVIATDVGDVHEHVDGLEYSTVGREPATLVDALVDLLEDRPVREGRENVEPLALDTMSRRIHDVYETAMGTAEVSQVHA